MTALQQTTKALKPGEPPLPAEEAPDLDSTAATTAQTEGSP